MLLIIAEIPSVCSAGDASRSVIKQKKQKRKVSVLETIGGGVNQIIA
jgi:hypothetical protein